MGTNATLIAVARRFAFVRETEGPNAGVWVNLFQRFTGNEQGASWCCSFVSYCESVATKGKMRFAKTASCDTLLGEARRRGWIVPTPAVGDLVLSVRADNPNDAHHVAICTGVNPLTAIAGNTSALGTSDNGDGVYEHAISAANKVFVRIPE